MKEDRNWNGVKEFFRSKIPELEKLMDEKNAGNNGPDKLMAAILSEVLDTLNWQLSEMTFFHHITGDEVDESAGLPPAPKQIIIGNIGTILT